jgi:hypothetical protein
MDAARNGSNSRERRHFSHRVTQDRSVRWVSLVIVVIVGWITLPSSELPPGMEPVSKLGLVLTTFSPRFDAIFPAPTYHQFPQ